MKRKTAIPGPEKSLPPRDTTSLQRAEKRIRQKKEAPHDRAVEPDLRSPEHDPRDHQTEREMQNEELPCTRQEMEGSEKKYQNLFDFAPIGYATLAADGTIVDVNLAGASLLGETRAGLVKKRFQLFIAPEDITVFSDFCFRVMASGAKEICTVRVEKKRHPPVDVQIVGRADLSGTGNRGIIRAAFLDISERRRLEDALRETSQYLENLINYANTPIVVWGPNFRITRFNRAFERLTGRNAGEVIDQPLDTLFSPETRDASMELIHRTMGGERWEVVEIPIVGGDGRVRTVLWNSAPIYGKDGRTIVSIIAQGQDITGIKEHEAKRELVAEELKRSNQELEQFAYVASHDLREPLRMVTSFSQLLAQRYTGKLDSDADEFIEFIVDGADRMANLIEDLLEFSRVAHGRPFERVDIATVIAKVENNLGVPISDRGAKISYDALPSVICDRTQMIQLFQNLVANAVKFCPPERTPIIGIGAAREEDAWTFSVRDNGIGIDPEFSEKIFVIFQRLHSRDKYPGTGIGLAICRRIVERHGGRIWVESSGGEGSTFYFTIPDAKEDEGGSTP
jgi:PAS domain S-box-containing protein